MLFRDRADAGRQLAEVLEFLRDERPVVLGLVRGGLVLAAEIAKELHCEFDVLVARKVGAPHHPEYGIGAVAPNGVKVSDAYALQRLGLSGAAFDQLAEKEFAEVERRLAAYRGGRASFDIHDRTAIVVDDGIATGVTAVAACQYVRTLKPSKLVLAVPVCTAQARATLEPEVDEFVCVAQPEPFYSVGQWYEDFGQVEDEQVLELLSGSRGFLA